MEKITAIIPVREGSRRLKNKNIAPFAGTNLLINKINQLKQVKEITNIVVSSDSELMLAMAKSQGVNIHKRAPEFCDEKQRRLVRLLHISAKMLMVITSFGLHALRLLFFLRITVKQFRFISKH